MQTGIAASAPPGEISSAAVTAGQEVEFLFHGTLSINSASSPNQVKIISVHVSQELESGNRDAQCRKRPLIKEKMEWLPVLKSRTDPQCPWDNRGTQRRKNHSGLNVL